MKKRIIQKLLLLTLSSVCIFTACTPTTPSTPSGDLDRSYNGVYKGKYNSRIAFPIGGLGAGMYCMEGTGYISHMSVRHRPEIFHEPGMFGAIHIKGQENGVKVLEGAVPEWRRFGSTGSGLGNVGKNYGFPRFKNSTFKARFPFANVALQDDDIPLSVDIKAWNPFIPGNEDDSSLPVGIIEYTLENTSDKAFEAIFSFHSPNFMRAGGSPNSIKPHKNGFVLSQKGAKENSAEQGEFLVTTDQDNTKVDHCWFRGGWFDASTMVSNAIRDGKIIENKEVESAAPGASLYVPFTLGAGERKTIKVFTAWYVPYSNMWYGSNPTNWHNRNLPTDWSDNNVPEERLEREKNNTEGYRPWYSSKFADVVETVNYLKSNYEELYSKTTLFTDAFYQSTLPPEVIEAVAANLTILKSPTMLRTFDGRVWNWEGCTDWGGSCPGSCTHVWNYAQALPHLFPRLERTLRRTEFEESQNKEGHQMFRSSLPIRPTAHNFHAAADGQLGGIVKVYRDWRISGDSVFLEELYPSVKTSLDYCIKSWDPKRKGNIEEPHHNTYDIEFWGPNGMHNTFYLAALNAFIEMSDYLGKDASSYKELFSKGTLYTENELFDGEYFIQNIQYSSSAAEKGSALSGGSQSMKKEAKELFEKEGPKYQYGTGCLADGILGSWMSRVAGLGEVVDAKKIKSHLVSVHQYNLKSDLSNHFNPQRSGYAFGDEGGLLLCTWPKGGKLSIPFVYSDEVWTGIEYQVASHLMMNGEIEKGLDIVRACRDRYDGDKRNPFNEYECGHWYARAMSSYALLQGLTGVRYDAIDKTLYVESQVGDFVTFLSTETGFGTVELKDGKATVNVSHGEIEIDKYVVQ